MAFTRSQAFKNPSPSQAGPGKISRAVPRYAILMGTDALIVALSIGAVTLLPPPVGQAPSFPLFGVVIALWAVALYLREFYGATPLRPSLQEGYELLKAAVIFTFLAATVSYIWPAVAVEKGALFADVGITGLALYLWRQLYGQALRVTRSQPRIIVAGTGPAAADILGEIRHDPRRTYEIVGVVTDNGRSEPFANVPLLGNISSLSAVAESEGADAVVLAITEELPEQTLKSLADCVERGCEVLSVSSVYERLSGRVPVAHIDQTWFIFGLREADRTLYNFAKRTFDVVLSGLGLIATALLFPGIAAAIKLSGPGPIIYSQVRVGKNGQPFRIFKFRSMVADAEANGPVWARVSDNRVTAIGTFLRRSRLDELPQFYNILKGDMSLIGPRPERPEFVAELASAIPFYNRRHVVLPGLTGWAQVQFPYGASVEDAREKLQYDLYYVKHRSVFLELEILLRTVSVVIKKTGSR